MTSVAFASFFALDTSDCFNLKSFVLSNHQILFGSHQHTSHTEYNYTVYLYIELRTTLLGASRTKHLRQPWVNGRCARMTPRCVASLGFVMGDGFNGSRTPDRQALFFSGRLADDDWIRPPSPASLIRFTHFYSALADVQLFRFNMMKTEMNLSLGKYCLLISTIKHYYMHIWYSDISIIYTFVGKSIDKPSTH